MTATSENNYALEEEESEICLPQTFLYVQTDSLIRYDENGNVVGKFSLNKISKIKFKKKSNSTGFVIMFLALALMAKSFYVFSNETIRIISFVFGLLLFFAALLGLRRNILVITIGSETVEYEIEEEYDILQGFVISLNHKISNLD